MSCKKEMCGHLVQANMCTKSPQNKNSQKRIIIKECESAEIKQI
jgi:hypothetical protein